MDKDAEIDRLKRERDVLADTLENICAGKLDSDEMKEIARAGLAQVRK